MFTICLTQPVENLFQLTYSPYTIIWSVLEHSEMQKKWFSVNGVLRRVSLIQHNMKPIIMPNGSIVKLGMLQ